MRGQQRLALGLAMVAVLLLAGARPAVASDPSSASGNMISARIVNGVLSADFPTTGALLTPSNPNVAQVICSGTLIGCQTFLTAGHCVCQSDGTLCQGIDAPNPSDYVVYLQHAGFFSVSSIAVRSDYSFPVGDVAVLKLGTPVTGIAPTPIDTLGPPTGTEGTIVGFGRTGGVNNDYGIKRSGKVITSPCSGGISDTTSVCWDFTNPIGPPGEDSNTCNGDSGGSLFVDYGSGPVLAGLTSGGSSGSCLANDASFDAKVAEYSSWIQAQGGADLSNTVCGSIPQVGGPDTHVEAFSGTLNASTTQSLHTVDVAAGIDLLRFGFNANDSGTADFDLYVKYGSPPTTNDFDCAAAASGEFGFCEFNAPQTGTWYVLVNRFLGSGEYQVTATEFGPDCSDPGNAGASCDDRNSCTDNDACQAGTCAGSPVTDGTACDDGNPCTQPDQCQAGVCINDATPRNDCHSAGRSLLLLHDDAANDRDRLVWRWTKGQATDPALLGNPLVSTDYTLCLYAGPSAQLIAGLAIPSSAVKWKAAGSKGFAYRDRAGTFDGIQSVVLKGSDTDTSKAIVKGKGAGLSMPALQLQTPVEAQLLVNGTGLCMDSTFSAGDVIKNENNLFKAKK
jgi:Trypsin/Bacterial pre-peptidase C-terminal domain